MTVNRRTICWFCLAVVTFGLIILAINDPLSKPFEREDALWVRGENLSYGSRQSAAFILRQVSLPLFGDRIVGYKLPNVLFHLGNALLIYVLVGRLLESMFGRRNLGQVRFSALVAGLVFLNTRTSHFTVNYFSALAYILVTTATLVGLLLAVEYLRSRRTLYWLGLLACYQAALLSHSFALGLPLFVLIMELFLFRTRLVPKPLLPDLALRYGPLAAMCGLRVWQMWHTELVGRLDRTLTHFGEISLFQATPLYYVGHLREFIPLSPNLSLSAAPVLVAFTLLAAAAGAAAVYRQTRGHGHPGVVEMFVVWLLAWLGMTLPHLLWVAVMIDREMVENSRWRLYFNQVGIAIFVGYLMALALNLLCRIRTLRGDLWSVPLCAALCGLLFLNNNWRVIKRFPDTIDRLRSTLNERVCRSHLRCADTGAGAGASMSCQDLHGADMHGADLSNRDLRGTQLMGANLASAHAAGADARDACFAFSSSDKLDLTGARLAGASFHGATLLGAKLRGAHAPGATFKNADLDFSDLSKGCFAGADMVFISLSQANLAGVDLRDADLQFAILSLANLRGADLRDANLRGADLRGADLRGADLRMADLSRARNLSHADLTGARMEGAKVDPAR